MILLHEEALSSTHPVFKGVPHETSAIYIWDDAYFNKAQYSLKRLVFIYEALCELPIDILFGSTFELIKDLAPSVLYVPSTNNPHLVALIQSLATLTSIKWIDGESFVNLDQTKEYRRFFQYWNKAAKSAFEHNGGNSA